MKQYTTFPISACKLFKPKDLYLLAGLYMFAFSNYSSGAIIDTNSTYKQLSDLTGVDVEYIRKRFMPRLKKSSFCNIKVLQTGYKEKRKNYHLPNPSENYRFIRKELFSDNTLSPEEKGFIIALYCLGLNNSFRIDIPDTILSDRLKLSRGSVIKLKKQLYAKNILWSGEDAPLALVDIEHLNAKIIMHPHLGYYTYLDLICSTEIDDDTIEYWKQMKSA